MKEEYILWGERVESFHGSACLALYTCAPTYPHLCQGGSRFSHLHPMRSYRAYKDSGRIVSLTCVSVALLFSSEPHGALKQMPTVRAELGASACGRRAWKGGRQSNLEIWSVKSTGGSN